MNATAREGADEYSREEAVFPGPDGLQRVLPALLLAAGLAGAALLVIADLSTLYEVRAGSAHISSVGGGDQHNHALLVIGLASIPMVLGSWRGSRAAAAAVAGFGLLALILILIAGDLHDIHSTGVAGELNERAAAGPKSGFYEETAGLALLLVAGGGGLVLNVPAPDRGRRRPAPGPGGGYQR